MQNNSTGMLATNVPVGVVPSAPRWPSWKIHTIAPNAAVSERTLSTNAFSGMTMLPVSRNSSTNMMTAMSPSTSGSRDVMASTLSRFVCAVPVMSTCLPAGAWHRVQAVELRLRLVGEQRSRAVDGEERAAGELVRRAPTAGRPGCRRRMFRSGRTPPKRRAPETGRRRSLSMSVALMPLVSGTTIVTAASELWTKSLPQLVADLVRGGRGRQHAIVGKSPAHAQERRAEQQQQRDARPARAESLCA